jgi:NAD+ diphosphatase
MPSFFDDRIFREASHANAFSGNPIERWSEARDETSLADAFAVESATVYLFSEDRALVRENGSALGAGFAAGEARALGLDDATLILLGIVESRPRFAGQIRDASALPDGVRAVDLRTLAIEGALAGSDLAVLAQARSYLHWHGANRFCGRCGGLLELKRGGANRFCPACKNETFPRVDPVVIMLAIDDDRCLLGRQPRFAPGMYSALAGFLEPGETIEEAVRREVKEESGIAIGRVAYYSSQAWPFPHSLMIGCHAEATTTAVDRDAEGLEDCRWFDREEIRLMISGAHPDGLKAPFPMAIAHHLIRAFAEFKT